MLKRFFEEEEGQTLVEYALLLSLVAIISAVALQLLGKKLGNSFNAQANQFNTSNT